MTLGKKTCKILKEIRQQIADRNDIEYITSECHFQGECKGTCPKCEAELQYLENELSKRRQLGKAVAVAGISLGLLGTFPSCMTYYNTYEKPVITSVYKQTAEGRGAVTGKVIDGGDKTPLEFASVRLMQNNTLIQGAVTDIHGVFTLDFVSIGKYDIVITYIGFINFKIENIEIEENMIKYISDITLKHTPYPLDNVIIGGL